MDDLKKRKEAYGTCGECNKPGTGEKWCLPCNAKRFEGNFKNWNSGNENINKFIQDSQLHAVHRNKCLEWIPFEDFQKVTYIAKGGFGTIFSATWPKGNIYSWDIENQKWDRDANAKVALKSLDDSSDINADFLNEVIKIINNLFILITFKLLFVFIKYFFFFYVRSNLIFRFIFVILYNVME